MKKYIERVTSILAAVILLQTLYFKFTGAPEGVHIFSALGMEPYGRNGLGVLELITAAMLLVRRTSFLGALVGLGIITGAILSHLLILGIVVENDGGVLFALAVIVFIMCLISLILQRKKWAAFRDSGMSVRTLFA